MNSDKRALREMRQHLLDLTVAVGDHIKALDEEQRFPTTPGHGGRIAKLCNALEMANDMARHFGLDIDLRTGKKAKVRI